MQTQTFFFKSLSLLLLLFIFVSFASGQNQPSESDDVLTFQKTSAGSGVNPKTGEKLSLMWFSCSDGTEVIVTHFYVGESYKKENARFVRKLKQATKVLEVTQIFDENEKLIGKRAVFQEKKEFKILKLFRVDRREYYADFEFYEIVAPTLRHLLAFENRKR